MEFRQTVKIRGPNLKSNPLYQMPPCQNILSMYTVRLSEDEQSLVIFLSKEHLRRGRCVAQIAFLTVGPVEIVKI